MFRHSISKLFLSVLAGLALAACNGGGGGGGTTGASFSVVDAPVDSAQQVVVTFDKIELKPKEGEPVSFELDQPKTIDLLDHSGSNDELIFDNIEAPAGDYEFIRLYLIDGTSDTQGTDGSYVMDDSGGKHDLFVPGNQNRSGSAPRNPLKLVSGFTLAAGNITDFVIDFDLRKALTNPQGNDYYLLRPAMRVVNKLETGSISGTVDNALVTDSSCTNDLTADEGNDVYLYTGSGASPGDVNLDANGDPDHPADVGGSGGDDSDGNTDEVNPLTTAEVTQNPDTGAYEYNIGFVAAGDYTIAFTCQSLDDEVQTDEAIEFVQPQDVTVEADQDSQVDFTATGTSTSGGT